MEQSHAQDSVSATVARGGGAAENGKIIGVYHVECRDKDGNLKWADKAFNKVTTVGVNALLDHALAGSAYTAACYMGLKGTGTAVVGDTMASHGSWVEVGNANAPAYTAPRKTLTFSAASGGTKASTGTYTYAITSSGTVAGCFLVFSTGAVSTIDSTAGVLLSAGDFTGGSKTVGNGDSLTVTYQISLTPA